jgi:hypothetical protein
MKVHANAPLGPKGRELMVRRVRRKWRNRLLAEGADGLLDRDSAPRWSPTAPTSGGSR